MTTEIVIAEAVRSAVGRGHKGALATKRPDELAADVVRGLVARVPQIRNAKIDDVVLGCAMPEGEQGLNVARLVALSADLGVEVPAQTINRFCSSGLQAIAIAAGSIAIGSNDVVIAGGVESMTYVPMTGFHLSASPDLMARLPGANTPMGITAENVAKRFGITRQRQDELAYKSQMKAKAALENKVFADEIVPVRAVGYDATGQRVYKDFTVDELPRPETTLEGLAKLPPAFAQGGSVTAGNSSPISDGAAAALVMSRDAAQKLGIKPLGIFRAFVAVGVDPEIMGIGPLPAVKKLLAKTGLTIGDIDLFEMNEAFAAQAVYCQPELGWAGGRWAGDYIEKWQGWVACALLCAVGAKMILDAWRGEPDEEHAPGTVGIYLGLGVATSIDAAVAGLTLPVLPVAPWIAIALIGVVTAVCAAAGYAVGRAVGGRLGQLGSRLGVIGGAVLVAIGIDVLIRSR